MLNIFILNARAGKGNSNIIVKVIDDYCNEKGANYIIHYTYQKEGVKTLLDHFKDYQDVNVYSIGGDGTLNSIVNAVTNTDMKLKVIPAGTGNDFYRSLKEYDGSKIDVGKVNDRYFINVASLGIDAEIANTANELKQGKIKGSLVYPTAIAKNIFKYKAIDVNVDNENKLITLLTVCNGKYYGRGFKISPDSKLNDGLFDICTVEDINKIQTLKLLLELTQAKHLKNKNVRFYSTDNIKVESSIDLICNVDGEIIKDKNFDFSIIENGINLSEDKLEIENLLKVKKLIK